MSDQENGAVCEVCGEPMPPNEQMFKYHGFSGPCPKPPLQATFTVKERGAFDWSTEKVNILNVFEPRGDTQFFANGEILATIAADGKITIDWPLVEKVASDDTRPRDTMWAISRLLIFVRCRYLR